MSRARLDRWVVRTAVAAMVATTAVGVVPAAVGAPPGVVPAELPAVSADGLAHPDAPAQSPDTDIAEIPLEGEAVVPQEAAGVVPTDLGAAAALDDEPLLDTVDARQVDVDGADLVGVTWVGPGPDRVEVRSQSTAGRWSDWTVLEGEQDPDGQGGGTDPWWTGGSASVEVRAWRDGASVAEELSVAAISTAVTTADRDLASQAPSAGVASGGRGSSVGSSAPSALAFAPAPAMPTVITRAQWGADPALMTWTPQYANSTLAAVLHHTAGSNTYTPAQSPGIVRGIYAYHAVSRGWGDIGYNVLVDQYGQIFEGRAGALSLPVTAAHAGGFNTGTFGVSMMGEYSSVAPSASMRESVARIIAWKLGGSYHFGAWEIERYTTPGHSTSKFSPGQVVQIYRILAHRDVAYTSCPGNAGYSILPWLRNRVTELTASARTQIWSNWNRLGGFGGAWGAVHQVETDVSGGSAAYFSAGYTVTYQPSVGVHQISPRIRPGWLAGGGLGAAGFPTTFEFAVGDGRGRAQEFRGAGSVIYSPTTGSRWISGALRSEWWRTGGATGSLGYPTRSQGPVGDGRGLFLEFEKSGSIVWTPTTGARSIFGPTRSYWWSRGGASGGLGYPKTNQVATNDGRGTEMDFEKGVTVVWSQSTGAHSIWTTIRDKWRQAGGAAAVGLPDAEPANFRTRAGGYSSFSTGSLIVWSSSTGARLMPRAFKDAWRARNAERGYLGLPVSDPQVSGSTTTQRFEGGTLVLSGGVITG